MSKAKRFLLWISLCTVLCAGLLVLTACDNEADFRAQITPDAPAGAAHVKVKVFKNKQKGHFNFDGQTVSVTCQVTLTGVVDGQPFSKTIKVKLSSTGAGRARPTSWTAPIRSSPSSRRTPRNFRASYSSGSVSAPLPVTAGLLSVATVPGQQLVAETGQQFVLISFPDTMPDGDYTLSTTFVLDSVRAIDIKPVITGKIVLCQRQDLPAARSPPPR